MTRHATARLFVALELPAEVRAQLAGWARRCASSLRTAAFAGEHDPERPARGRGKGERGEGGHPGRQRRHGRADARGELRLLHPETLHVTLCFLGERPVGEIDAIGEALATVCTEARSLGRLSLGAPLWLPPRRPRALAVELHDDSGGALHALQHSILRELTALCELESDPAAGGRGGGRRFRPHVTVARLRAGDAPRQRALPATPALAFAAGAVTLQRSWLSPSGADYECLSSHALAAQP
ncbi:MAG TPA: RNA 2',3'-cyclic phosphodiesterase [Solirubrobacteraceae bacterium]|nr:RNA 2',3'-cyclic phosphodiesterase [Solirubrobacteraceae bacterium]